MLFKYINSLGALLSLPKFDAKACRQLAKLLDGLVDYTIFHFQGEEDLFEKGAPLPSPPLQSKD